MNQSKRQPGAEGAKWPWGAFAVFCGRTFLSFVALRLGFALSAVNAAGLETPRRGGTLRLASPADIRSLDPLTVYTWEEGMLAMMLYRPLLDYDENEQLVPMLAESLPAISADGRSYTFRLKSGILFSTGREVVAEDVVYSLERHLDPNNPSSWFPYYLNIAGAKTFRQARSNELALVAASGRAASRWLEPTRVPGLRAVDRYTLQVELEQPDLIFSDIMASPYSVVVPREEVEKPGGHFRRNPVGCGPFVLKEWKRGIRLRLARNPRYFLAERPFLDGVELLFGLDSATQIMMLERQELDWINSVPDADFLRLKRQPGHPYVIESMEGNAPYYISLNCELPPFKDRRVRQALNYAVNKEHLLRVMLHRGVTARGVLPNAIKGFNPNLPGYPYNTNRAVALLREAGHTAKGAPIRLLLMPEPEYRKIALVVKEDLRVVGVQVELQERNTSAWLEEVQRRTNAPMAVADWVANFNDPRDTLDCLVNGERITERDCVNLAFYSNPKVNDLFCQAAPEMNPATRLRFYRRIEELVVEDAPWIFLINRNSCSLRQSWLRGFKMRAVWPPRLDNVWLAK